MSMSQIWVAQLVLPIVLVLSTFGTAQDVSPANPPKLQEPLHFPPSCTTDQALYANRSGKVMRLETDSLLKGGTHREAPEVSTLALKSRIA
jgi:hypothetical protein